MKAPHWHDDRLTEGWRFLPDPIGEEMRWDGPVRFRIVEGDRDDGTYGVIGAAWLAADLEHSGWVPSPFAAARGSDTILGWREALERGFSPQEVYEAFVESWGRSLAYGVHEERTAPSPGALRELLQGGYPGRVELHERADPH